MTRPYTPQADSVATRVITYFKRLPDEELMTRDIASQFDCKATDVLKLLAQAVDAQFLTRDGSIYSAGPNIKNAVTAPDSVQNPQTRKPRRQPNIFKLDADSITIHDGPLPQLKSQGAHDKWTPLLKRLTRVGQWIELPIESREAVASAISKQHRAHAARYSRGTSIDKKVVVFRVK